MWYTIQLEQTIETNQWVWKIKSNDGDVVAMGGPYKTRRQAYEVAQARVNNLT